MRNAMQKCYIFFGFVGLFRLAIGQDNNCGGIKLTAGLQSLLGNIPLASSSPSIPNLGNLPSLPEFPTSDYLPPLPALGQSPSSSSECGCLPSLESLPSQPCSDYSLPSLPNFESPPNLPSLPTFECSPNLPSLPTFECPPTFSSPPCYECAPSPPYDCQPYQPPYPCVDFIEKPCCLSKCFNCFPSKCAYPILPPPYASKCGGCLTKLCRSLSSCGKKKLCPLLTKLLLKKGLTLGIGPDCDCCSDLSTLPSSIGCSLTGVLNQPFAGGCR